MLTANEIRHRFLEYFKKHGHTEVASSSLIPRDDPSLLFTNAGMVQFKKIFCGQEKRDYVRATTSQKCLRVGGKHNDLDNVGRTARHHTFFEMLGNFSFGDYFKEDAIRFAWTFITEDLKLPKDRLYITVYKDDDEAFELWQKVAGVAPERIFRLGEKDNFWSMGDTGPCGPCSEIYIDQGEDMSCGPDCGIGKCDCDRFLEIWNLVFTQFDQAADGSRALLAAPNIDTGMGLERIAAVCQGKRSNFDCDLFQEIIQYAAGLAGVTYSFSAPDTNDVDTALRVIADHSRSAAFLIAEGVLPSNENRGYVLRRLIRRALRFATLMGVHEPFMHKVARKVTEVMGEAYPDLPENADFIDRAVFEEEQRFSLTLEKGLHLLDEELQRLGAAGQTVIPGAFCFKLYDTYGFPLDLTKEMAADEGMTVDEPAFQTLMKEQRERARAARSSDETAWAGLDLGLDNLPTKFTGYERLHDDCTILAIVAEDELRERVGSGVHASIVLDKTPFYAEMGGQSADHGLLILKDAVFEVHDVQKNKAGKVLHHGVMVSGNLAVGDKVNACVDTGRRKAIMRAHSATHLLHKALRTVLGDHVHQAGSLVEPDRLRFDFTHFSAMKPEEIASVERMVNEAMLEGFPITVKEMPIAEARSIGAMALFGEKYGDVVRVVDMGDGYSVEFCGGTHLDNTAKVGSLRIVSEFSIASGVRRIEAITGQETLKFMENNTRLLMTLSERLKAKPEELLTRAEARTSEIRELRSELEKFRGREMLSNAESFLASSKKVGPLHVFTGVVPVDTPDNLRKIGDFLRDKDESIVAVLAAVRDGKITFHSVCGKAAIAAGVRAGDIIRSVTAICGGKGGGKPDSAMGGGADTLKLDDALATVDDFVAGKLN